MQPFLRKFGLFKQVYIKDELGQVFVFLLECIKALFVIELSAFFSCMRELKKRKAAISGLISFTGQIDTAIAIASVRSSHRGWCKPFLMEEQKKIIAREIYHPLVPGCVRNSIEINHKSILITGSNMSGKTTFIRIIAINSLMAQSFYTCFASYYQAPVLQLHTSIRISDDLLNGKSYFMEEVATVKAFIDAASGTQPCLFVLDEVFKGTNTVERVAAAKAVLSYLNRNNHLVIVSTHDIELAGMLAPAYDLYHFEDTIRDDQLVFDHMLKSGPLTTRNAIRILQLSGYPQPVIEEARDAAGWLRLPATAKNEDRH